MKTLIIAGAAFIIGVSVASAAQPWRVFATGTDQGAYAAFANASADAPRSHALAVRVTATPAQRVHVDIYLNCTASVVVPSGTVVVAATPLFSKCSLMGSGRTDDAGRVKVELLRRP